MKYYLVILLLAIAISCTQPEIREDDCPKPQEIPKWVKWDCDKDAAYKQGDIYFNEDSTVFAYGIRDSL